MSDAPKPWLETWTVEDETIYFDHPNRAGAFHGDASHEDEDRARAKLAAAAPEMARLLLKLEIVGDGAGYCPACHVLRPDLPHKDSCEWVTVLTKAGVLPT
jgi:hypothetical protein